MGRVVGLVSTGLAMVLTAEWAINREKSLLAQFRRYLV